CVRLRPTGQADDYRVGALERHVGDLVLVETPSESVVGEVRRPRREIPEMKKDRAYPRVLRLASDEEARAHRERREREERAIVACQRIARSRGLVMKVVDVEMHPVARRTTVYFNAEERIDFRDLVRDLARELRSRGELRHERLHDRQGQIDPRPQAERLRRLPRRHPGRGADRSGHVGETGAHQGAARAVTAFYLTTPIYYVNDRPHLGHAYTTIVVNAMARYRRLAGDDVWFLTGTDEHGDKIAQAAAKAGITPQAMADQNSAAFRATWQALGIQYSDYIRTTEERHKRVVQAILQTLWDAGEIYLGKYGGHYCYGCERFYTEKEIVDGKCPDHQTPLTWIEEENYFFKMSKYQSWLIEHLERNPDFVRPERYRNEVLGFLRDPLTDLSISRPRRRLEWGIPLPFDDKYVT